MTRTRSLLIALTGILAAGGAAYLVLVQPPQQTPPADLVLRGGRIVTLDDQPADAQALAARDGRIVAVGSNAEISSHIGSATQIIELNGLFAMPGFIEGHGHFTGIGENKINLDLLNTTSWDHIVQTVAQAVEKAKPGQWIIGRGWHQEKWTRTPQPSVEGFPTHQSLDAVSPHNPVVLRHASGHASFVNRRAMELSSRTRSNSTVRTARSCAELLRRGDAKGLRWQRVLWGAENEPHGSASVLHHQNFALAAFEDDIKGTLSIGKLADITVLTKDITRVPDDEIMQAKVAYTIIGGKVAYEGQ